MTALGVLSIGAGALLIYAGFTGQSAVQLVGDTLLGRGGSDDPDDVARAVRDADPSGIDPDAYEAEKQRQGGAGGQ